MEYSDSAMTAALGGVFAAYVVVCLAISVVMLISMWVLFSKAGEPGWAAIIPIYSTIVMLKIGGKPWYWVLLIMFIPIVNIIFAIMALQAFLSAYGKGDAVSVILALFFSVFYFPYLAFSKNVQYVGA